MKLKFVVLILLFFLFHHEQIFGQNLVPNPSFEDTVFCPSQLDQVHAAQNWSSFGFSPDYYNVCGPNPVSPPTTEISFQQPNSGNAFAGLVTYVIPGPLGGPNWHEILGTQLASPLIIGNKYYISFYANYANNGTLGVASNNIGVKLSTVAYSTTSPPIFDGVTVANLTTTLVDSINWTLISGSFIADSNYQYLLIGNFYDDSLTDTINLYPNATTAYYFVDDVCLSLDSMYCQTWTGIHLMDDINLNTYPNPFNNHIAVSQTISEPGELSIYNSLGQKMSIVYYFKDKQYFIDFLEFIPSGLYYLRIRFKNGDKYKTIIHN